MYTLAETVKAQVSLRSREAKQDILVISFELDLRQPVGPRLSRSPARCHSIASLAAGFVAVFQHDWSPPPDAIFATPLALRTASSQYRLVATADYRPCVYSPWPAANDMEPWECLNYLFDRGETEQTIQLGRGKSV